MIGRLLGHTQIGTALRDAHQIEPPFGQRILIIIRKDRPDRRDQDRPGAAPNMARRLSELIAVLRRRSHVHALSG